MRQAWVDTAKGVGIALVFYGHFIELYFKDGSGFIASSVAASMAEQWRFIYSFHIPLFFFLSGFVWKPTSLGARDYLARLIVSRIGPVIFYSVLAACLFLLVELIGGRLDRLMLFDELKDLGRAIILGRPYGHMMVTWFLVCMFTMEIVMFGMDRLARNRAGPSFYSTLIAFLGVCCYLTGIALAKVSLGKIYFLATALVCMQFYIGGILTRAKLDPSNGAVTRNLIAISLSFVLLVLLYNKNQGALWGNSPVVNNPSGNFVVLLVGNQYGNIALFPIVAWLGILLTVSLAQFLSQGKTLATIGKHSLHLFCLNGLMLALLNRHVVSTFASLTGDSVIVATAFSALVAGLQILVSLLLIENVRKIYEPWNRLWGKFVATVIERKIASPSHG